MGEELKKIISFNRKYNAKYLLKEFCKYLDEPSQDLSLERYQKNTVYGTDYRGYLEDRKDIRKEISYIEKLTIDQEIELFKKVKEGNEQKLKKAGGFEADEELITVGNQAASDIITANLYVVCDCIEFYKNKNTGLTYRDMVSELYLYLISAVNRYDYKKSKSFASYIEYYIPKEISTLQKIDRISNYSDAKKYAINQMHIIIREKEAYYNQHNTEPSIEYLAEVTKFDINKIKNLENLVESALYNDHKFTEEDDIEPACLIEDTTPFESLEDVINVLKTILSEKEIYLLIQTRVLDKTVTEVHREFKKKTGENCSIDTFRKNYKKIENKVDDFLLDEDIN